MTAPEEDPPIMALSPVGAYKAVEDIRACMAELDARVRVLELAAQPTEGDAP
jgi:hypothetical protein